MPRNEKGKFVKAEEVTQQHVCKCEDKSFEFASIMTGLIETVMKSIIDQLKTRSTDLIKEANTNRSLITSAAYERKIGAAGTLLEAAQCLEKSVQK